MVVIGSGTRQRRGQALGEPERIDLALLAQLDEAPEEVAAGRAGRPRAGHDADAILGSHGRDSITSRASFEDAGRGAERPPSERAWSPRGTPGRPCCRMNRGSAGVDEAARMKDPDKPQQIIDAAIRVFARNGYYNSRVSDIAREAGIASGTIYLYFKTKDEILVTLFREKMAEWVAPRPPRDRRRARSGGEDPPAGRAALHACSRRTRSWPRSSRSSCGRGTSSSAAPRPTRCRRTSS